MGDPSPTLGLTGVDSMNHSLKPYFGPPLTLSLREGPTSCQAWGESHPHRQGFPGDSQSRKEYSKAPSFWVAWSPKGKIRSVSFFPCCPSSLQLPEGSDRGYVTVPSHLEFVAPCAILV